MLKTVTMIRGHFLLLLLLCSLSGCDAPEVVLPVGDPQDILVLGTAGGFCFQPAYKLEAGELFKSAVPSVRVGNTDRPDTIDWILLEDPMAADQATALREAFPANRLNKDNQRFGCSGAFRDECCFFTKLRGSQGSILTWVYEDGVYNKEVDEYFVQVGELLRELSE